MPTLIFDTETTALISNSLLPLQHQPHIIEMFGHLIDEETGEVLDEVEFMCHPGFEIEKVTTDITGITRNDLKDKPRFITHEKEVVRIIEAADKAVAHNISYDYAIVNFELARCNSKANWPQLICTVEETEWIKGFRLSLSNLHLHLFEEPFEGAHRARVDVAATTRCYLELKKRGML